MALEGKVENYNLSRLYIPFQELKDTDVAKLRNKQGCIGSGAHASVYKATYKGQQAAIKVIDPDSLRFSISKVFNELEVLTVLSSIAHPNIPAFFGFSLITGDNTYVKELKDIKETLFVTEYITHGSLISCFDKENPNESVIKHLSNKHNLQQFIFEIVDSIDCLHHHEIVHRDLAARNILVDEKMRPKLCDFGEAYLSLNGKFKWKRSEDLLFPAPERVDDYSAPPSKASDIWGLGILLLELYCMVYKNETYAKYLIAQRSEDYYEIMHGNERPFIPEDEENNELIELIKSCLSEEPKDRPTAEKIKNKINEQRETKLSPVVAKSKQVNRFSKYCNDYELEGGLFKSHPAFDTIYSIKDHDQIKGISYGDSRSVGEILLSLDILHRVESYQCPNLLDCYGVTSDGCDVVFLVEKLPTLQATLDKKEDSFTHYLSEIDHFLLFIFQLTRVLADLHRQHMVLGQVDPAVVFVTKDYSPKLFPLKHASFDKERLSYDMRQRNYSERRRLAINGCSPELSHRDNYSFESDIWLLALLILEIHESKNKRKYNPAQNYEEDKYDLDRDIVEGKAIPHIPQDLDPEWQTLIQTCFEHDCKKRPTASKMTEFFERKYVHSVLSFFVKQPPLAQVIMDYCSTEESGLTRYKP